MRVIHVIKDAIGVIARIPIGARAGLVVIGFGIVLDLIAHLSPGLDHDHAAVTGPQLSAHLIVFLGMVLLLAAVVIDGVRSSQRSRGPVTERRHLDALR